MRLSNIHIQNKRLLELTLILMYIEMLVKSKTRVGRPNPNAKRKFFVECPFSSFKIVQDLDKHSKPCIPYIPVIDGSKKRRGITQQTAIIIFDLRLVKIRSLLLGKNIIIHLKKEIEDLLTVKK